MDAVLAGILGGKMGKPQLKQAGEAFVVGDLVTEIGGIVYKPKRKGFSIPSTDFVSLPKAQAEIVSVKIDSTRTLAVYQSTDYPSDYEAKIITVNGNDVTYGPVFRVITGYSSTSIGNQDLILLDSGRAGFAYYHATNKWVAMVILSFSGSTITGKTSAYIVDTPVDPTASIGPPYLSKNSNNDIILTYKKQKQAGDSTSGIVVKLMSVASNNSISILNTFEAGNSNFNDIDIYTGAYCLDNDRILFPYTIDISSTTKRASVLLIKGISTRSMNLVASPEISYYGKNIYDMVEISENNVLFLSNDYDLATAQYVPRIGKFTVTPTSVAIASHVLTSAQESITSSKLAKIDSTTFVHITKFLSTDSVYPNRPAIRILYVIDGVIQLGTLEPIRPSTTNSIYAPDISNLDGTAMLVTSSSNDGGYKFFNKIISIIDDSPMSGVTVSKSSVDLDGVEKVLYLPV